MENRKYLPLSLGGYVTQFSLSIYLFIISIILLVNEDDMLFIGLLVAAIIIGLIRLYSLRIRVLSYTISKKDFETAIKEAVEIIGDDVRVQTDAEYIQIERIDWGIRYGEVLTIYHGEKKIYINSRCMDSRGFVLSSFGRNRINYRVFENVLKPYSKL